MKQNNVNWAKGFICLTVLCASVSLIGLSSRAMAQYAQVQPYISPKDDTKVPEDYHGPLLEAMQIHSAQYQINMLMTTTHPNVVSATDESTILEGQVAALNECNIKRLNDVYQNPEEAWKKMTSEYTNRVNDLKVYINASSPTEKQDDAEQAFVTWRVGRDMLIDVYAEPEKYGSLRSPDSGFKRWKDQDYVYAEQVNDFLGDVVRILGVNNVPGVSRDNPYSQNAQAYQAFLDQMKKAEPKKFSQLSQNMLSFPMPPKPLPPANEIIQLTLESSQGQLFPSMPEPWAYYVKNQDVKRLPNGEMNEYYQPDSLKLRMEVGSKDIDNRFEVYQQKKGNLQAKKEELRIHQSTEDYESGVISERLKSLGIQTPLDINNLEPLKTELINRKKAVIAKTRKLMEEKAAYETNESNEMTDRLMKFQSLTIQDKLRALDEIDRNSPEYTAAWTLLNADQKTQDAALLDAMEKDTDGSTMLTQVNAKDVDQLMKASKAQAELVNTVREEHKKSLERERAKTLNADCFFDGGL